MILASNNNPKQLIHITSRKFRKRKDFKVCKKTGKKFLKNSSKDEKLIYAFFLDIA
tara:strand:- start:23 stop:190 length:168 start_codon:yes stop_codon:yes gene_type:complete